MLGIKFHYKFLTFEKLIAMAILVAKTQKMKDVLWFVHLIHMGMKVHVASITKRLVHQLNNSSVSVYPSIHTIIHNNKSTQQINSTIQVSIYINTGNH